MVPFRSFRRAWVFAPVCVLLLGCATQLQPVASERIDQSFGEAGGAFDSGTTITVVAKLREDGGSTSVCGAWMKTQDSAQSGEVTTDVLATISVIGDGDMIVSDFNRFTRLPLKGSAIGMTADCFASEIPWRAAFATPPTFKIVGFRRSSGSATQPFTVFTRQNVKSVLQ